MHGQLLFLLPLWLMDDGSCYSLVPAMWPLSLVSKGHAKGSQFSSKQISHHQVPKYPHVCMCTWVCLCMCTRAGVYTRMHPTVHSVVFTKTSASCSFKGEGL